MDVLALYMKTVQRLILNSELLLKICLSMVTALWIVRKCCQKNLSSALPSPIKM